MYLGIEIGGTKLQLAVGLGDGSPFVALVRRAIDGPSGAAGILAQIEAAIDILIQQYAIRRIGIGFGGPVDTERGRVIKSHQVTGWDGVAIADWCRQRWGVPATLANDCDAAALAEARFGAGRDAQTVFYVTVGTGIGGGLVIGGRLHGAGRPAVAEIGHLRPGLQADRPDDTVEAMASGPGIAAAAQARLSGQVSRQISRIRRDLGAADRAHVKQRLQNVDQMEEEFEADLRARCEQDLERLNARLLAQAASEGNEVAREVIDHACQALGWAVAQTVTLIAPEVVVVGGGVSLMGETLFFAPLRRYVQRFVFPPLAQSFRLLPAALGEEVVVHGALAIAKDADSAGR